MAAAVHVQLAQALAQQEHAKDRGPLDAGRFSAELAKHANKVERMVVDIKKTHLTMDEASSSLSNAFQKLTGNVPSRDTLRILTAQWAHETGGGKSMLNYNFGGIKGTGPTGLSIAAKTHEGYGDSEVTIRDHFRAYESADDGATDYVSLLRRRFPVAFGEAEKGNLQGFATGLKDAGYYTDSVENYQRGLERWAGDLEASGALERMPTQGQPHRVVSADALVFELERAALRIARENAEEPLGKIW